MGKARGRGGAGSRGLALALAGLEACAFLLVAVEARSDERLVVDDDGGVIDARGREDDEPADRGPLGTGPGPLGTGIAAGVAGGNAEGAQALERVEATRPDTPSTQESPLWEMRDPFVMQGGSTGAGAGYQFMPGPQAGFPSLALKAIVVSDGDRVGLIEIGGKGVFLVREGDVVSYRAGAGSNAVVKIRQINELEVLVEAGTLGEVVVLR